VVTGVVSIVECGVYLPHHDRIRQTRILIWISPAPHCRVQIGPADEDAMSPAENSQQAVMDFLGAPATHGGAKVTRIDTHAAAVFLAGDRVLKIKRAVCFPFLDYSTLAKRKSACEAEIAVNQAFAPAIYRGVVAITRKPGGGLAIGGDGEAVEWAVEMRRFDETQTLDHLADRGEIDEALADALGRAVAKAHALAPVAAGFGFADELTEIIAQNDAELAATPDLFPAQQVAALGAATRAAFARVRPLLEHRQRAGFVRRCHGDLHLGNIVLLDGQPTLFDAIEFDPNLATGDVFYDLAFLLMDLIERGLNPAANIVLNRYLNETRRLEDLDALAALPLFLSVRAAIRAKVTAARAKLSDARTQAEQSARNYFALARKLLAPPPPQLVAVGGLSGTGKSWLARKLAPELWPAPGAVVLRSDVERKALFGLAETERLPQAAYAAEITVKVYSTLEDKARRVIAAGHSAIVDAVFADAGERAAVAQAAAGVGFHGLYLTADLATRISRVGGRKGDASDADAAVARAQERYDLGAMDWLKVDASGSPEETLRRALSALRRN
jgi:aminoglycoside phosphotransferase family enzyme/cytidylate kinase